MIPADAKLTILRRWSVAELVACATLRRPTTA
jgi:hypothetical protein